MNTELPEFPSVVSFTLTGACNLKCRMCGQRGENGCVRSPAENGCLPLGAWLNVAGQLAGRKGVTACLRGGEPFLYPDIIALLSFMKEKGISVSIDTNGMFLEEYALDIARLGIDNINVSIDGPEQLHDSVRGVKGSFRKIAAGVKKIKALERQKGKGDCVKTVVFTASPFSRGGLPEMPAVARELGVEFLVIVPYYYFDENTGKEHERAMEKDLGCRAVSWRGFCRRGSGVNPEEFLEELRACRKNLEGVKLYPFMGLTDDEYRAWFTDCSAPAGKRQCRNPWKLIDIQPDGSANFCVDLPDYSIGNVLESTIEELWRGKRAEAFRARLLKGPFPACGRCGAKYI
jgi:MoaA/NifB/PqqE/SkfB family radical SAM enzyme